VLSRAKPLPSAHAPRCEALERSGVFRIAFEEDGLPEAPRTQDLCSAERQERCAFGTSKRCEYKHPIAKLYERWRCYPSSSGYAYRYGYDSHKAFECRLSYQGLWGEMGAAPVAKPVRPEMTEDDYEDVLEAERAAEEARDKSRDCRGTMFGRLPCVNKQAPGAYALCHTCNVCVDRVGGEDETEKHRRQGQGPGKKAVLPPPPPRKAWNLCQDHGCKSKTSSGKIERDPAMRWCKKHMRKKWDKPRASVREDREARAKERETLLADMKEYCADEWAPRFRSVDAGAP
jgi:hypothetical protein